MWRLQQTTATLRTASLEACFDLRRPQGGLTNVRVDGANCAGRYLAVELPGQEEPLLVDEAYVRGTDLFVRYGVVGAEQIRLSLYYRVWELPGLTAAVEAIVSLETAQLDSCPQACIVGERPGGTLLQIATPECPELPLIVLADTRHQFAFIAHPRSGGTLQSTSDASHPVRCAQRVQEHLEKGVIRRTRVLGVWYDTAAGDHAAAIAARQAFVESELPLTA